MAHQQIRALLEHILRLQIVFGERRSIDCRRPCGVKVKVAARQSDSKTLLAGGPMIGSMRGNYPGKPTLATRSDGIAEFSDASTEAAWIASGNATGRPAMDAEQHLAKTPRRLGTPEWRKLLASTFQIVIIDTNALAHVRRRPRHQWDYDRDGYNSVVFYWENKQCRA